MGAEQRLCDIRALLKRSTPKSQAAHRDSILEEQRPPEDALTTNKMPDYSLLTSRGHARPFKTAPEISAPTSKSERNRTSSTVRCAQGRGPQFWSRSRTDLQGNDDTQSWTDGSSAAAPPLPS